jgi:pimeloyl-ACP methyl ester carboxylesterase
MTVTSPSPISDSVGTATSGRGWRTRVRALLDHLPDTRRGRLAAGSGVAVAAGAVVAGVVPRGPVTVSQVWALLVAGVLVGFVAGALVRSCWVLLLAPAGFVAGFEAVLAVFGHPAGYTMGWFWPHSSTAWIAVLSGRVVLGLVVFPALGLGAVAGRALLSRLLPGDRSRNPRSWTRRIAAATGAALLAAVVAAVGAVLSLPGHVSGFRDADGHPIAGSIARWEHPSIGGTRQWVLLYGRSVHNPVVLFLSGGPGGSEMENLLKFDEPLADRLTLAIWEQRGSGKSYPSIDAAPLTVDRQVRDVAAVTDWLRERFDVPKVYLLGHSYGTILGVLAAQQHPERYYAYIGTAQMVATTENDRREYRALLEYATRTGDSGLANRLRGWGEPPYAGQDVTRYTTIMAEVATKLEKPHLDIEHASNFFAPQYGMLDKLNTLRGFADAGGLLYPQLRSIDFRRTVPTLSVPVFLVHGRYDHNAIPALARQWYRQLQAPTKDFRTIDRAAHGVLWDQAAQFVDYMIDTVLIQAPPRR